MVSARDSRAFLGVGLSFPLRTSASGDELALVAHDDDIREAILIVLRTDPGARPMLPEFGAGLRRFVFASNTTSTRALLRDAVERALVRWEPRIDVQGVRVSSPDSEPSLLEIEVDYQVRSTNTFYNLVFPFYLQEQAG